MFRPECLLWLALRHRSVTIDVNDTPTVDVLWLALRHRSVTMGCTVENKGDMLWLALRHRSVTISRSQALAQRGFANGSN